ncbi:MAG: hypothetical protein ACE5KE_11000, partial [Methanosarcinales archaeon]
KRFGFLNAETIPDITNYYTSDWGDPWTVKPDRYFYKGDSIQFNVFFYIDQPGDITTLTLIFDSNNGKLVFGHKYEFYDSSAGNWVYFLKTSIPYGARSTKDGQDAECMQQLTDKLYFSY